MSVALFDVVFKYFSLKLITNLLHASLKKQRSFMINYQNSRKRHTHSQKTKRSQQYCSKTFTTSPYTLTNPHTMFLIIHPSLPLTSLCQFNYPKTSLILLELLGTKWVVVFAIVSQKRVWKFKLKANTQYYLRPISWWAILWSYHFESTCCPLFFELFWNEPPSLVNI